MKSLKSFFTVRETYFGLAAALAFQVIFFIVWLTAYDGVYDRIDQLNVAAVIEDTQIDESITAAFVQTDVIKMKEYTSLEKAQQALERDDIQMVIHMDESFTDQLRSTKQGVIDYYINQAKPTIQRQMMEEIAREITLHINTEVFQHMNKEIIPEQVLTQATIPAEAKPMAEELMMGLTEQLIHHPVNENVIKLNNQDGFAISMIPLLIVLASFIGAMLISQHLHFAEMKLSKQHSLWANFMSRQLINIAAAMSIACLTIGLLSVFNVEIDKSMLSLWGFQSLLFYSFLALSQLFVMLFGNIGMVVNIVLVALQLAASGALVPRPLLSTTYQQIGEYLPATYGADGYFTFIYGGSGLSDVIFAIITITIISLVVACSIVLCKQTVSKRKEKRKTIEEPIGM